MITGDRQRLVYRLRLMELYDYLPRLNSAKVFERCDSMLEEMFALGAMYAMDCRAKVATGRRLHVVDAGGQWEWLDPWQAFTGQIGPSTMTMRPQTNHAGYRWDFGVFWESELAFLVEVDGYYHHRQQRPWDEEKRRRATVPAYRLLEETESKTEWPAVFLDADWTFPCNHCGLPLRGDHGCPPF